MRGMIEVCITSLDEPLESVKGLVRRRVKK